MGGGAGWIACGRPGLRLPVLHSASQWTPLTGITLNGDQLTWKQAITKPMRLNLAFAVAVDGDNLTGISKAGRLPPSKVTGQRRAVRATAPTT